MCQAALPCRAARGCLVCLLACGAGSPVAGGPGAAARQAAALDQLEADLGQAQFELEEVEDRRAKWSALCDLHAKGSPEWLQCRQVLTSSKYEVDDKEAKVATLQRRASLLEASLHGGGAVQGAAASDAAEVLGEDGARAEVELRQLEAELRRWQDLCSVSPPRFLDRARSATVVPDKPQLPRSEACLRVVAGIEDKIGKKKGDIAMYQRAAGSLDQT